jgi:hypothetical protein
MLRLSTRILLILCLAGSAAAAPVGTGAILVDVEGTTLDDNAFCTHMTYADQTYDVFGTNVNLATEVGEMVCTGATVAGVPQVGHCESYPDPSRFAFDFSGHGLCQGEGCPTVTFVLSPIFNVTGTLPSSIGSSLVFSADGSVTNTGPGSITVPGCPLTGAITKWTGATGVNAFEPQAASTGTNQTVSFPETTFFNPLTQQEVPIDVAINFSQVTEGGTVAVTATSNAAGEIPANFAAAVNGFYAAFLEISTTATVVPPIEICSSYADADDDGYVDGTSPGVPESALSFLHGEGDPKEFVDRTSSRDPVSNVICAQVDSLSPFAIVVRTNGVCAAENDPCEDGDACTANDFCNAALECVGGGSVTCDDGSVCTADACVSPLGCTHPPAPAGGCNAGNAKGLLLIRDQATDSKDQILFKWLKGTSQLADFGDPLTTSAYTLCVFDANKMLASATAPAASACGTKPCWKLTGPTSARNGVLYNDPLRQSDGVKLVKGKAHDAGKARVLFKALGAGIPEIDLAGITYPVTVQVRTADAACWEQQFDASDEKRNDGAMFKAVHVGP